MPPFYRQKFTKARRIDSIKKNKPGLRKMLKRELLVQPVLILTLLLVNFIISPAQGRGEAATVLDNALKIINFLDEMARIREETGRGQSKVAEFEQKEVNAFFQYLFTEQVPAVRTIELKLFPKEKIEGHLLPNLSGYNLPSYFKDEVNLYFSTRVECLNQKIRLVFDNLYLETQRIEPQIIDYLIDLIASFQQLEAHHLGDWYDLPSGVEKISTNQGKLRIYY